MNISETAEYYFAEIFERHKSDKIGFDKKTQKIYALFKAFHKKIAEVENAYFPSEFARLYFLFDKYNFNRSFKNRILALRVFIKHLKKNKNAICDEKDYIKSLAIICEFISFVSQVPVPIQLNELYSLVEDSLFRNLELYDSNNLERVLVLNATPNLKSPSEEIYSTIDCVSESVGEFQIVLLGIWADFAKLCAKRSLINAFNLKKNGEHSFITTPESLLALEPDYLIDATEIAEKFYASGQNVYHFFISKFFSPSTSTNLLVGNIVNHLFDEIILNPEVDFDSSIERAFKNKPLQLFSIVQSNRNAIKAIRNTLAENFQELKIVAAKLQAESYSVEPSFISADYGLQGRLDLLLEYEDDFLRKDVVELKSGRAPNINLTYYDQDSKKNIKSGLWRNHWAQTTCYNMLLDSAFPGRKGSASILYSKAEIHPIRNAPNSQNLKREVLMYRNWVIALEQAIMKRKFSLFDALTEESFDDLPIYAKDDAYKFLKIYKGLSDLEKEYLQKFIAFIFRESYHAKIGSRDDGTSKGFSSLWLDSIAEKEISGSIISGLTLLPDECDFVTMKLAFSREISDAAPVFREGDICIIYPMEGLEANPLSNQIIKGSIRTLKQDKIIISLRNKMIRGRFNENATWALEADYVDSLNKSLFVSLFDFISSPINFKRLIFNLRPPEFEEVEVPEYTELNENQKYILKSALAAKDYFLIQGPPGTGKTSYMLRFLVKTIYDTSEENILLLAYTNRAADEICASLKRIDPNFPVLRLGSKESSSHDDILISGLADSIGLRELFKQMENTRVIVSTVSSALNTKELFEMKTFGTAIIDEASQILEPQILGILSKVDRFIMIGDEKQLPAVVTQPEIYHNSSSDLLHEIGLDRLSKSLFERLLQNRIASGDTKAYGLLERQARMHEKVQILSNNMFYGGALKIFDEIRQKSEKYFDNETNEFIKILNEKRCIFIDTPIEKNGKINIKEAKIAAKIVESVYISLEDKFNQDSIGVIASFRAQCARINSELSEEIKNFVAVDTVERFQGSERDCIIVTFAVNDLFRLSFLTASMKKIGEELIDRKLNVALTRAKNCLVLVGNSKLLSKSPVYEQMIKTIKDCGGYFKAKEFFDFFKEKM